MVATLKGHTDCIRGAGFTEDCIISGSWDTTVSIWSVRDDLKGPSALAADQAAGLAKKIDSQ